MKCYLLLHYFNLRYIYAKSLFSHFYSIYSPSRLDFFSAVRLFFASWKSNWILNDLMDEFWYFFSLNFVIFIHDSHFGIIKRLFTEDFSHFSHSALWTRMIFEIFFSFPYIFFSQVHAAKYFQTQFTQISCILSEQFHWNTTPAMVSDAFSPSSQFKSVDFPRKWIKIYQPPSNRFFLLANTD